MWGRVLVALRLFLTHKEGTRSSDFQSNELPLKFIRRIVPYEVPLGKNNNKALEPYGLYYRQRYNVASELIFKIF